MKDKTKKIRLTPYGKSAALSYGLVTIAFIVMTVLNAVGVTTNSLRNQLVPICVYIVLAVSLNLVVGISGELSLGHAGFMSIGAFTGAVVSACLANQLPGMPRLFIAMIFGGIVSGIAGFLIGIPVLRLRGDYLAIVTLAFGEIIRNILNVIYIGLDNGSLRIATSLDKLNLSATGQVLLNGPMGATGIQKISTFTAGYILIMFTLFVVQNLINSKHGRAIMAIRDNRIAAESVGLSATHFKMTAFVTSAALAGMAGTLFALNYSTVAPVKFNFNTSILILVFVVLGGMGNIAGSIVSATVLTILPEALRQFADYRMLAYAVVLILVMLATNNKNLRNMIDSNIAKISRKKAKTAEETIKEVEVITEEKTTEGGLD